MLEGVRSGPIIAGAYTSPEGTCSMLAAHRRGGRTSLDTFARAWDSYTGATNARLASGRELRTLESILEISLGAEEAFGIGDLGRAIAEHREVREREVCKAVAAEHHAEAPRRPAPGDPDRTSELRGRPGWRGCASCAGSTISRPRSPTLRSETPGAIPVRISPAPAPTSRDATRGLGLRPASRMATWSRSQRCGSAASGPPGGGRCDNQGQPIRRQTWRAG